VSFGQAGGLRAGLKASGQDWWRLSRTDCVWSVLMFFLEGLVAFGTFSKLSYSSEQLEDCGFNFHLSSAKSLLDLKIALTQVSLKVRMSHGFCAGKTGIYYVQTFPGPGI
jgi:hypothetical protein